MKDEIAARPPPVRFRKGGLPSTKNNSVEGPEEERSSFLRALESLLESRALAVLATQGDVYPYVNLVAFAQGPDLKFLLFSTTRSTRKFLKQSCQ